MCKHEILILVPELIVFYKYGSHDGRPINDE